jgi:hypothetical protein
MRDAPARRTIEGRGRKGSFDMDLALNAHDIEPADVRRRFAWARRQGNPAWLWPDIAPDRWRAALTRLEAVVRQVLAGESVSETLDGDPEALGLAGYTSGVGPLLGYWIEQNIVPASPEVAAMFALHLAHNRIRVERMTSEAIGVAQALAAQGIACTLLKGLHTAHAYFPEPGTRPASDIDLLVAASDEAAAGQILRACGFVAGKKGRWECDWRRPSVPTEPRSLSFVHADDPWSIDLHISLNVQVSAGAPVTRLDEALSTAESPPSQSPRWRVEARAQVLAQPLSLIQLAVHAGSGLQNLTLLRLVELCLVIRRDGTAGTLDWDAFLATAAKIHALALVYPALKLCDQLVPGTVPARVLERCGEKAPIAVRRIVDRLTPASAQRVDRCSVAEHFMWADSWRGRAFQVLVDIGAPLAQPWPRLWSIYEVRAWRLFRRTVTR